MPVAINTFVILGGLMNKDNVVATLKQNAIVRRNFTDVCIKKVNDLNYGLVDYVYLQDKKKGIGVRFPVEGVDSDISEEAFIDIVLQACISYAKSESKIRKCSDIRYAVKNHTLRIKLSYKGLEHTIDTCMIAGELLDLNVLIQSVISDNDDSMYRSFIPCNKLLQIVHDYRPTLFKNVIKNALANKGFVLVYGKDYMQQIYDKFVELWGNNFGYYEKLNIWSNIYDEGKVNSFKAEYEKEQQLEQSKRLAARVQSANDEITECMKVVQTYEDLYYVLDDNKYVPDESRSFLHKQVYEKLQELVFTQELDRYAIDIAYNLLDADVIDIDDFVCMFGGEE